MKQANEINQLLDSIIACGESMAKLGRLLKESIPQSTDALPQKSKEDVAAKTDTAPAEVPKETKKPDANTYTFTDVRKAFSAKSHEGYTNQVKGLITKYGAEKLSDVKESDYPALMADLEVIG